MMFTQMSRIAGMPAMRLRLLKKEFASSFLQVLYVCLQMQEVSRLRARPKGFPIALWKPSVPYAMEFLQAWEPKVFLQVYEKGICLIVFASFVCMLADTKGFAPAGATKGLSDRPLETFGPLCYGIPASLGA